MANLRQLGNAVQMYAADNNEMFPAQRAASSSFSPWWGITLLPYVGNDIDTFHCPTLKGPRIDYGTRWQWKFDVHNVGYGYNAYFLGAHPYSTSSLTVGGIQFTGPEWFKRSAVVHPSENILLADKVPYGNPPMWSSALWWPTASMAGSVHEGVVPRHANRGVVVFNDGHPELRLDTSINPPVDPVTGSKEALKNSRFWDPLQRSQ